MKRLDKKKSIRRVGFRLRVLLLRGAGRTASPSQTSIPIWKLSQGAVVWKLGEHVSCGQVGGNHSACGPHQGLSALGVRILWVPEEISPWKYVCSKLRADWMLPGVNYMSTLTLAQGSILTRLMKAIIEEGIPYLVHPYS